MKKAFDSIGTLLLVLLVSVLVWLYAEDANVKQYTNYAVSIEFQPPTDREMRIEPSGERVLISFSGSNGQFQQLQERIRDRSLVYQLSFDPNDPAPEVEVDLRQVIEDQLLQELGVNLTEIEPRTVIVQGEAIENVTIPVVLDTRQVSLANTPEVRPAQVSFRVSHSVAEKLRDQVATARLTDEHLARLVPGQDVSLTNVPITPPDAAGNAPPSETRVSVVIRQADNNARLTLNERAVMLSYPPSLNQRFVLELNEGSRFANNLELEGPRDQIEAVRQSVGNELVWATVRLTNDEVESAIDNNGIIVKTIDLIAPAGVRLVSEPMSVTIRVQPRGDNDGVPPLN
ncbi:MAG: hypothetical protein AAGC44_14950 [Planctomycetota bacterium]